MSSETATRLLALPNSIGSSVRSRWWCGISLSFLACNLRDSSWIRPPPRLQPRTSRGRGGLNTFFACTNLRNRRLRLTPPHHRLNFPESHHLGPGGRARFLEGKITAQQLRDLEAKATMFALNEKLGVDVLVDGEMYRGDMVAYFAEASSGIYRRRPRPASSTPPPGKSVDEEPTAVWKRGQC